MANNDLKERVRVVYARLRGYYAEAPEKGSSINESSIWHQFHSTIDELNELVGDDRYNKFKVTQFSHNPHYKQGFQQGMRANDYRSKLNALIMELHAEFLSDQPEPNGPQPGFVLNQNQTQSQETRISMLMEVQTTIDKKLFSENDLDEKEKGFLEKIKEQLPSIKSSLDLVRVIAETAKTFGLEAAQIAKLFS